MFLLRKNNLLIVLPLLLAACGRPSSKKQATLYPVDSLIVSQALMLEASHARLEKEAFVNNREDNASISPNDSAAWWQELDVFLELNAMNNPTARDAYTVEDGLRDSSSNLTIKAFTCTDPDLPIAYLRVYYHESLNDVRKIEAKYVENNLLLKSKRILTMEFQDVYNKRMLHSYSIIGGQKLFLADTVQFKLTGRIIIP